MNDNVGDDVAGRNTDARGIISKVERHDCVSFNSRLPKAVPLKHGRSIEMPVSGDLIHS